MGLEGVVSKRKGSGYASGRSPHWIKSENPNAPAVKREAEEDWGRKSARDKCVVKSTIASNVPLQGVPAARYRLTAA